VARLPGRRCIAFDARGHGLSSKPAPPYAWRDFGRDAAKLAELLELRCAIGVGHSLGGHAVALAAALGPGAFAGLVLLDPVIRPRNRYTGPWTEARFVSKRRNRWASSDEMFETFAARQPFDAWDRRTLRDYCDYALIRAGDGFALACPPEVEASIYEASPLPESNIYPEIAALPIPVHVIRAGRFHDPADLMRVSPTAPDLASIFERGRDTCLPGHSHFIPMEAPDLAAKFIEDALALL